MPGDFSSRHDGSGDHDPVSSYFPFGYDRCAEDYYASYDDSVSSDIAARDVCSYD